MTDFVNILRSAIEGLKDDSPDVRERVYQRARVTLATKLATIGPAPATVAERYSRVLEEAIATVEGRYRQRHEFLGERASVPGHDSGNARGPDSSRDETAGDPGLKLPKGPPQESSSEQPECLASRGPTSANPADAGFRPSGEADRADGGQHFAAAGLGETKPIGLVELTKVFACNLEWPSSSRCGICLKWATCIDLGQCWNRADEPALALEPAA